MQQCLDNGYWIIASRTTAPMRRLHPSLGVFLCQTVAAVEETA
jgi:hypothetical protein